MEELKQQIVVLPNIYNDWSSSRMIGFMINKTLRDFLYYRDGSVEYFAADYEEGLDLERSHRPDIILLDKTASDEEARKAIAIADTANRNSRVIMALDDEYLSGNDIGTRSKVFTYSAEDPDANFYAQKIYERPEGGFTFEIVFQVNPKGNKGLSSIIFPNYNRGLVLKTSLNSNDRADIVHAVKTFAVGCSLSIDNKYISQDISSFVFDNYRERVPEKTEQHTKKDIEKIMRRKEFEED